MSNLAQEEQPESARQERGATRLQVRFVAGLTAQSTSVAVVVHNLSASGILIETDTSLTIGQSITVELPEAKNTVATVIWQSAPLFGCRFTKNLSRAALSAAKLRNPLSVMFDPITSWAASSEDASLGQRLLRLRRDLGLSRAALSALTGFSKPSIWAWETGRTAPRRENLTRLAEVYNVPRSEILRGSAMAEGDALLKGICEQPSQTDIDPASLRAEIDAAKARIAALSGTEPKNVRITIEY